MWLGGCNHQVTQQNPVIGRRGVAGQPITVDPGPADTQQNPRMPGASGLSGYF
jgi:hypothetical protein